MIVVTYSFLKSLAKPLAALCVLIALLVMPSTVFATAKSLCPQKVLDTQTIEGVFKGVSYGDYCHAEIQLDSGESIYLICDEMEAERLFGNKVGQKISVSYDVMQFWDLYGEYCKRAETVNTWKIIDDSKSYVKEETDEEDVKTTVPSEPPVQINLEYKAFDGRTNINIIATTDSVQIRNIVVNRGNLVLPEHLTKRLPADLNFGQNFVISTFYVTILEVTVETNLGTWTSRFNQ